MKIGVAKRCVSTTDPEVRMAGFGNPKRVYKGVRNDLWVRALVFQQDGETVAVVTGDTLGFDRTRWSEIEPEIKAKTGLTIDHILFNASHTHSAPNTMRELSWAIGRYQQKYADWYYEQVVGVLQDAYNDLEEASLELAWGVCYGVGVNRRRLVTGAYEFAPNELGLRRDEIPVFRVSVNGRVKAVWTKLTCHPSTVGFDYATADWPGIARDLIEERNPGAIAIFTQGCCGNIRVRTVNAKPFDVSSFRGGQWEDVDALGKKLADAVQNVLENKPFETLSGGLSAKKIQFSLPLQDKLSREEYASRIDGTYHDFTYQYYLEHYEELPTELPYTLQRIDLGDQVTLIGMEGEVVVDYEYNMDMAFPGRRVLTLGYSNGNPGYICTEDMYRWGGYEPVGSTVCYNLLEGWRPEAERIIMAEAEKLK